MSDGKQKSGSEKPLDNSSSSSISTSPTSTAPGFSRKLSNYYYFSSTPKEEAELYTPKQIFSEWECSKCTLKNSVSNGACEICGNKNPQRVSNTSGPSLWNNNTTWEDRDMSDWTSKHLKTLLENLTVPSFSNGQLTLTQVSKVEGDATIVFTRGKKKNWI